MVLLVGSFFYYILPIDIILKNRIPTIFPLNLMQLYSRFLLEERSQKLILHRNPFNLFTLDRIQTFINFEDGHYFQDGHYKVTRLHLALLKHGINLGQTRLNNHIWQILNIKYSHSNILTIDMQNFSPKIIWRTWNNAWNMYFSWFELYRMNIMCHYLYS